MKIEVVSINKVFSNPENPRVIKDNKFKKLVNSIIEFPEMLKIRPIVVNSGMIVLGGNMRLKACKEAGLKEIPIIIADSLTSEQQKEFIIKDNSSFGEWDFEALANTFDMDVLNNWGVDIENSIEKMEKTCEEKYEDLPINVFPIGITADKQTQIKWCKLKKQIGIADDSLAFKKLINDN